MDQKKTKSRDSSGPAALAGAEHLEVLAAKPTAEAVNECRSATRRTSGTASPQRLLVELAAVAEPAHRLDRRGPADAKGQV